jgi:hypothetical protein
MRTDHEVWRWLPDLELVAVSDPGSQYAALQLLNCLARGSPTRSASYLAYVLDAALYEPGSLLE